MICYINVDNILVFSYRAKCCEVERITLLKRSLLSEFVQSINQNQFVTCRSVQAKNRNRRRAMLNYSGLR